MSSPPEVGGHDARVASHLVGRPGGDHLAELQHDDPVADVHHEPHVVVDEEGRGPGVGELPEPLAEILALVRVEPRRGLVQAEEPGLHRDRPRDPDELPLSLGQLLRHRLRDLAEVEQLERALRRGALAEALPDQLGGKRQKRRALGGDGEVLAHGEVVEQLGALPGSGKPAASPRVRRQPGQVVPIELDAAL
jgi:hypothetical protein